MAEWSDLISRFHFLRPAWLLALLPLAGLWWLLWRHQSRHSSWSAYIPDHLLRHLLEGRTAPGGRWPWYGLALAWLLSCVALAGPTWERLPQPVHRSTAAVVVVLDLSPSMRAEDMKPSRLVRTRYKLTDYLDSRREGLTALVAYAGEAHVVSPLTDDTETIKNLLPVLEPNIMPLAGSNVEMAVEEALGLFEKSNLNQGDIVLFTDGVAPGAVPTIRKLLAEQNVRLSIVGVGTPTGAPIPTGDGGFARGRNNDVVIAKLNEPRLRTLASQLGGRYTRLGPGNDLETIKQQIEANNTAQQEKDSERQFDRWQDRGHWLAVLLIPFAALAFRRGWLLSLAAVACLFPEPGYALGWKDLWQRPDQQGQELLQQGRPGEAADKFQSPEWRGTAHYRNENYQAAAETFANKDTARAHYNRGNALAKAGQFPAAIDAYERALEKNPDLLDATHNKSLVEKLLRQQKQQGNQQNQNQQSQSENQQGQGQSQNQQQEGQNQTADNQNPAQQKSGSQSDSATDSQQGDEAAQQLAEQESTKEPLSEEEQKQQQMAQRQAQESPERDQDAKGQPQPSEATAASAEKQQALEQWLRQVPDDPGGLLRRKFEYQHRQLRQEYRTGEWAPPTNQAYERW